MLESEKKLIDESACVFLNIVYRRAAGPAGAVSVGNYWILRGMSQGRGVRGSTAVVCEGGFGIVPVIIFLCHWLCSLCSYTNMCFSGAGLPYYYHFRV